MSEVITRKEIEEIAFKQSLFVARFLHEKEKPIFIQEACELTFYSKATIYALTYKNKIPYHKVSGKGVLFFYRSELIAWMESGKMKVGVCHA